MVSGVTPKIYGAYGVLAISLPSHNSAYAPAWGPL